MSDVQTAREAGATWRDPRFESGQGKGRVKMICFLAVPQGARVKLNFNDLNAACGRLQDAGFITIESPERDLRRWIVLEGDCVGFDMIVPTGTSRDKARMAQIQAFLDELLDLVQVTQTAAA